MHTPTSTNPNYGASGCRVLFDEPLYFVQQVLRLRRAEKGTARTALITKGSLRKRLRVGALHSTGEIKKAFERA